MNDAKRCALWRLPRQLHEPGLAVRKNIKVVEPFQGTKTGDGSIHVLGPSQQFYRRCITADLADKPLDEVRGFGSLLAAAAGALARAVVESWDAENLAEPAGDAVEPLNHSSTIIHLNLGEHTALLTADAGVQALNEAIDYAVTQGIDVKSCHKVQIPHHGSKRNVGPAVLNRILGNALLIGTNGNKTGMLSCAKDGEPKHPSARVTNAFLRRGSPACATKDAAKCFRSSDAPDRGWSTAQSIPFRETYNEDD